MPTRSIPDTERFLARVEQRSPAQCWWWTGAIKQGNWPVLKLKGERQQSLARFAWEIVWLRGPVPQGYVITRVEHDWEECQDPASCPHRICMNPSHMRLTPKRDILVELQRQQAVPRTTCRRGHPLTEDNVVWLSRSRNKRMCKICHDNWLASRALQAIHPSRRKT